MKPDLRAAIYTKAVSILSSSLIKQDGSTTAAVKAASADLKTKKSSWVASRNFFGGASGTHSKFLIAF